MSSLPRYTLVPETLKSFRVLGTPTPNTLQIKLDMLFEEHLGQSLAIVIFDAFRCSSTLLACFAADIYGAVIMEKGQPDRGTSIEVAQEMADQHHLELILGGELSGKPIAGGIVGNSPIDAWVNRHRLRGNLLHFQSTNFAKVFVRAINAAKEQPSKIDIYVISFANAQMTAEFIGPKSYDRVLLLSAGFFECIALEDMVLGGMFASRLGIKETELDDDAIAMIACHRSVSPELLAHSWTARVLSRLSKDGDVSDLIGQTRFPKEFADEMAGRVLRVCHDASIPMIRVVSG